MAEAKAKWDEVGDRFAELGKHLKERYDANAAFGADEQDKVERRAAPDRRRARRRLHRDRRLAARPVGARRAEARGRRHRRRARATFNEVADEIRKRPPDVVSVASDATDRRLGTGHGMTSMPSSASSCWRGLAPSDARSSRPLRNRPIIGMLCTPYSCASCGSSSMLTFTTL